MHSKFSAENVWSPDLLHALHDDEELWRYIPVEQLHTLDAMSG